MRRILILGGLVVWAAGCGTHATPGAVEATVIVDSQAKATCLRVVAQSAGGPEKATDPIQRAGAARFVVAIFPSTDLAGQITVVARGFVGADCGTLIEQSAPQSATFQDGNVQQVTLQLNPATCELGCTTPPGTCFRATGSCGADGGCVYSPADAGAPCTDDGNPCTSDLCDGRGACAHLGLDAGAACGGGTTCVSAGTCNASAQCLNGTPRVCDSPRGQCLSDAGTCQEGVGCVYPVALNSVCQTGDLCILNGRCAADAGCVGTPMSCSTSPGQCFLDAGFCIDGGCAYPIEVNASCVTGDPCLINGLCGFDAGCVGTPVVCSSPPGQCFSDAGSCGADGGCGYPVTVPAACNTGDPCITGGQCEVDGGCAGTAVVCNTPPGACYGSGFCQADGGCAYLPLTGNSCSTGTFCVTGETCDAGTCGGGGPVVCAGMDCFSGLCSVLDGGCNYTAVAAGTPCDAGTCANAGVCHADFRYPVSNFDAGVIVDVAPPIVINCPVAFDSTTDAGAATWCGSPGPALSVVAQPGGAADAVVLSMAGLHITPTGTLFVTGSRPVILAVFGDATVDGVMNASANSINDGPSGNAIACAGAVGPTNGNTGGGGGGGGFSQHGANGGNGGGGGGHGAGSAPTGSANASPLRGGCSGGAGGAVPGAAGSGGGAGGALQMSVARTLVMDGGFFAEGGGGQGAGLGLSGGGGGGSGGAILLEADTINVSSLARLTANGGGGGQGATNALGGGNGQDGLPTTTAAALGAGTGTGASGNGGAQSGTPTNGQNGNGTTGGGGGGGSDGYVRLNSPNACQTSVGAVFSPAATSNNAQCP